MHRTQFHERVSDRSVALAASCSSDTMIAVGKSFYCMHIILNGEGNIPIEFNKSFMWALPAITTRKTLTSSAGFLAISSAGRRATATML